MKENKDTPATKPDASDELAAKNIELSGKDSSLFVFFFYLIIGVIVFWSSETAQSFLTDNIWPIAIIAAIVILAILISWTRSGGFTVSVKRRIAIINYGAIPILLALVVAIYILPHYHVVIIRSFFLLIVCLLPATLYYLFIASSKSSLLHEYFTNLSRLGFVIGAFPPIVWQIIQSAFRTVTGARFFVPSIRSEMPVNELDGLTVWHEARLEEEDIENVPNMATTDLVELMLHTRIPPERIIDWIDQAILYTLVGPEKKSKKKKNTSGDPNENKVPASYRMKLRRHGIRTASDLIVAYDKSKSQNDIESFEKILPKEGRHCIKSMVDVLSTYPNVNLILRWRFLNSHL